MEHYFTAERLEELKAELEELKNKKRAEVAERLKRAKELGDLSENAEYSEAKDEQAQVESRILELEDMIKNASIITKSTNTGIVQVGSTIDIEKDGQKSTFTIVGSNEAKPEAGLISNESPIGKAFVGKKAGEKVDVTTPTGTVTYKVLAIK